MRYQRTGANGLPLILGGDWNDGMNRVGEEGKGESVWLGWFLLKTLGNFTRIARAHGDAKRAKAWEKHAQRLKQALENAAWDGEWYRRGSYDDGTPLGSRNSDECKIDSIAQSWSVLSGGGDPVRSRTAMEAATRFLVDDELKIVKLFTPPFSRHAEGAGLHQELSAGRAREWRPVHPCRRPGSSSRWPRWASADEAWRCFSMLNPVNHALDEKAAEQLPHRALCRGRRRLFRRRTRAGAAAGPGTRARPAGCIARPSRAFSASARRATG